VDDAWQDFLLNLLAYVMVAGAGGIVLGGMLVAMPSLRRRLLPVPRLRPGRWGGGEVLFALLALPFAHRIVVDILAPLAPPADDRAVARAEYFKLDVIGSPLWVMLTLAIVITLLFLKSRTRPYHYGITWARWPANVVLGIVLYLVLTPLTLAIYLLAVLALGGEKNLIELTVQRGFTQWQWALLLFMTVIGAPLTEEVLFRGVLQGWLRRATLIGHIGFLLVVFVLGAVPLALYSAVLVSEGKTQETLREVAPADWLAAVAPFVFNTVLVMVYAVWLWRLGRRHLHTALEVLYWHPGADLLVPLTGVNPEEPTEEEAGDAPAPSAAQDDPLLAARQQEWGVANARLAILGSAALFALAHGWPNAIPLLVFGAGVGWLAYRTQSLIGGIVCHALFNSVACIVLAWSTR
jgi:membrane protease YdiL (CAAX protease family)